MMPSLRRLGLVFGLTATALFAAAPPAKSSWRSLFDGSSVAGWQTMNRPADAPLKWQVEGDVLAWRKGAGHLISREVFGDFELELEWKISAAGNSGVMFRAAPDTDKPWQSGPEIQLLDNAGHGNGKNPLTTSGAVYALYPPEKAAERPVGEWNRLRLRVVGSRLQAWMNGERIHDLDMAGADWKARVADSKFAPFPEFARSPAGRLILQDHGNPVWFRHIRIRPIAAGET